MGIRLDATKALAELNRVAKSIDEAIVTKLTDAGEELVDIAKETHTYKNRTGNLTASIGYGVVKDGNLVKIGGFDDSLMGGAQGEIELRRMSNQMTNTKYAIIVIAGADYAESVNRKGFVVLDDAELSADEIVERLLSQIEI